MIPDAKEKDKLEAKMDNLRGNLSIIPEEKSNLITETNVATDINGSFANAKPSKVEAKRTLHKEPESVKSIQMIDLKENSFG